MVRRNLPDSQVRFTSGSGTKPPPSYQRALHSTVEIRFGPRPCRLRLNCGVDLEYEQEEM